MKTNYNNIQPSERLPLSVVIITWNQADKLSKCLNSILFQKINCRYEIILVDNNSCDKTYKVVERYEKDIVVVRNSQNKGVAPARNQGILASKGRYIMMLDDDTEVLPGCFDNIVCFMDLHKDVWCAGTKQLKPDGSLEYNARRFYTIPSILFRRTFLKFLFPNSSFLRNHFYLDWDHNSNKAVDWVAGASFVMRREAIDKIGLFDENYFFGFEDVDWCYRVKLAGKKTYYLADAAVIHHVQGSSRRLLSKKAFNHLKSAIRFVFKFLLK